MSLDDRDYMRGDGAAAADRSQRRSGSFGSLRWELEECPEGHDCSLTELALAGAVGYGVSLLLGLSPLGRLVGVAAGAFGAQLASRYHLDVSCAACGPTRPEDDRDAPEPKRPL